MTVLGSIVETGKLAQVVLYSLVAGVGIAVLLIALAGVALLLIPKGGKAPQKAANLGTPTAPATPKATRAPQPALAAQVRDLDALMRFSERGRTAGLRTTILVCVAAAVVMIA